MCMICNVGDDKAGQDKADQFIAAVWQARRGMEDAERALLGIQAHVPPHIAKQYDRAHKAMVRARKVWNRIEEIRERPIEPVRPISAKLISEVDGPISEGFLPFAKPMVFMLPEGAKGPFRAVVAMSDGTVREIDIVCYWTGPACANMTLQVSLEL